MTEYTEEVWIESLYGEEPVGPFTDEVAASDEWDERGLTDDGWKLVYRPTSTNKEG